jgi:hypothetical protein
MDIETVKETKNYDPERAELVLRKVLKVFQKHRPTTSEIILILSNLTYSLGGSIESLTTNELPPIEELQKQYYTSPTIGVALMLQGLLISTWFENYQKTLEND